MVSEKKARVCYIYQALEQWLWLENQVFLTVISIISYLIRSRSSVLWNTEPAYSTLRSDNLWWHFSRIGIHLQQKIHEIQAVFYSCTIKHPTKGYKTYQGFYQNKKNDAEASAAQLVIRDWDITLLDSKDIPGAVNHRNCFCEYFGPCRLSIHARLFITVFILTQQGPSPQFLRPK